MKKILFVVITFFCLNAVNAQLNINLVGQLPYSGHGDVSDIWGHVDGSGNEYALVGLQDGTSIVDISEPTNPNEIFFSSGGNTEWRDLKVWNNHLYIVNEASGGLKIIDMSNLPGTITGTDVYQHTGTTYPFTKAHDLYIDENGFAYIMGANNGVGGVIILDLNTNPKVPVEVGRYNDYYVHDGMVRGDTLWAGCMNNGFFAVIDVTIKSNPVIVATQNTPSSFSHNIWPSDDGQTVFTTDEKSNAFIASYDISNLSNISELDRIQSSQGELVIPHNVFVLGDYLVTSYYTDGVIIHDASDPSNLVEVGHFDTSPTFSGNGFFGCWGVYPYLPSGLIIASDIENGLFILDPTYSPASYLNGNVTDSISGSLLDGVKVHFLLTTDSTNTNVLGDYEIGIAAAGTYDITYSKSGYISKTVSGVILTSGNTGVIDVELKPSVNFAFQMQVIDASTSIPISNASVQFHSPLFTGYYNSTTDVNGFITFSNQPEESWDLNFGKWGYKQLCLTQELLTEAGNVHVYEMEPGYQDDFRFDFGWTEWAAFGVGRGSWERNIPIGIPTTPEFDSQLDCDEEAYITSNQNGGSGSFVQYGEQVLASPIIDLSLYVDPYINYDRWFFNGWNSTNQTPLNDSLVVELTNGIDTVQIDYTDFNDVTMSSWVSKSIQISSVITITNLMNLLIRARNRTFDGHIVEAGFDNFKIIEGATVGIDQINNSDILTIYPNPFNSEMNISFKNKEINNVRVEVLDIAGRLIDKRGYQNTSIVSFKNNYKSGIYFMSIYGNDKLIKTEKIIKF
jgi:choice-of-anchor B domain-containing protein